MKRKIRRKVKVAHISGPPGPPGPQGPPGKSYSSVLGTIFAGFLGALLLVGPLHLLPLALPDVTPFHVASVLNQSVNVVGSNSCGSGILFHSEFGVSYVLTGAHVVDEVAMRGVVEVTQGANSWSAMLVAYDADRDLALLRLDATFPVGRGAQLAHKALPVGTPLVHVGNVQGFSGSFSGGFLSAKGRRIDGQDYWQSSIPAYPGSSGGGVFTTDGRLAGVLLRGIGPGLNFFAPVETIKAFARDYDLTWLLH